MRTWSIAVALAWLECAAIAAPLVPAVSERQPLPEPAAHDWPMFRHDPERSGFAAGSSIGSTARPLWSLPRLNVTGYTAVKSSPAIVDGVIYCGTDTGRFLAVRAGDGKVLWQVQIGRTSNGIHGSPAIAGDLVLIGAYDGTLYAFDRPTGRMAWRYHAGYQVGSSPAVVARWGVVFSAHEQSPSGGGIVVALDARTGALLWRQRTVDHPHSSVAVDVGRGLVFVGDNHGIVYAFDARTGRLAWRSALDRRARKKQVKATPMVIAERGLLVVSTWSGTVYALDEVTGKVRWTHAVGGHAMGSAATLPSAGTVFVGSPLGALHALDADTGRARWIVSVRTPILSSPAVSGDGRAVVFGASDGNVYALAADTGRLLWRHRVGGQVSGSPALVGDRIYVTSRRGGLWALESQAPTASEAPAREPFTAMGGPWP